MSRNWISERHMRQGGSLNPNPSRQRKGPLRKIVQTLSVSTEIFGRGSRVVLECGHECFSHGIYKARCSKCAKLLADEET